jgi:Predicted permease
MSFLIWGFAIAYVLNPIMVFLEAKFKLNRILSIIITYIIFLSFITLLTLMIIPGLYKSILDFSNNFPDLISQAKAYLDTNVMSNKFFIKYDVNTYIANNLNDILTKINATFKFNLILQQSLNLAISQMINISSMLFNLITGIIISIYLLKDKEVALKYIKKFIYTFFNASYANNIIRIGNSINIIFKEYVIGKSIDSVIIGLLCFICLQIMSMKYSLLISIIIAVTNLIPYFGNIIGLIPSLIITIFSGPVAVLKLILLILVLCLFDGWFLSPKIVGEKVGLSPIWIIIAITIGGSFYGALGMFLGVPIAAIIRTLLEDYIDKKYEKISIEIKQK